MVVPTPLSSGEFWMIEGPFISVARDKKKLLLAAHRLDSEGRLVGLLTWYMAPADIFTETPGFLSECSQRRRKLIYEDGEATTLCGSA